MLKLKKRVRLQNVNWYLVYTEPKKKKFPMKNKTINIYDLSYSRICLFSSFSVGYSFVLQCGPMYFFSSMFFRSIQSSGYLLLRISIVMECIAMCYVCDNLFLFCAVFYHFVIIWLFVFVLVFDFCMFILFMLCAIWIYSLFGLMFVAM